MSELFANRYSKRAFAQQSVPRDMLDRILEAARWAPSCFNNQPWTFIIADDAESRAHFGTALADANVWAKAAPVLIIVAADPDADYTRKDDPVAYHVFDTGLAVENLLLAAVGEGLMAHAMAGYKADAAREAAGLPANYHVVCMIALGYEGSPDMLDDATRAKDEAPRERKPLDKVRYYGRYAAE